MLGFSTDISFPELKCILSNCLFLVHRTTTRLQLPTATSITTIILLVVNMVLVSQNHRRPIPTKHRRLHLTRATQPKAHRTATLLSIHRPLTVQTAAPRTQAQRPTRVSCSRLTQLPLLPITPTRVSKDTANTARHWLEPRRR